MGFNTDGYNTGGFNTSGSGTAPIRADGSPYIRSGTIDRGIDDFMWHAHFEAAGLFDPSGVIIPWTIHRNDHLGVDHVIFYGVVPNPRYAVQVGKDFTAYDAFSFPFFMQKQPLTLTQRKTMVYNDTDAPIDPGTIYFTDLGLLPGAITYIDPEIYVRELLPRTGLTEGLIQSATAWMAGTLKQRAFDEWTSKTTKNDAAKDIAGYMTFLMLDSFNSVPQNLFWFIDATASDDNIDIALALSSPVVISDTDSPQYLKGPIDVDQRYADQYNRIVVRGKPTMQTEQIDTLTDPITITLLQPAIFESVGVSFHDTVLGTDRDLVSEGLVVENGSATSATTQITIAGVTWLVTDLIQVTYLPAINFYVDGTNYYESVWETAGVIAGTDNIMEAPPYESENLHTQAACDDMRDLLREFYYNSNQNVYTAVFKDRVDLAKMMLRISFNGWGYVTTEDLRVVHVSIDFAGPRCDVTLQMVAADHLRLQMLIQRIPQFNEVRAMEAIYDYKNSKKAKDESHSVIVGSGYSAIVRSPEGIQRQLTFR